MRVLNRILTIFVYMSIEEFLIKHKIVTLQQLQSNRNRARFLYDELDECGQVYYMNVNWLSTKIKIGKFLTKFYSGFTPGEITHICERIKAIIETPQTFKILEGDELKTAYYLKHYVPNHGTLSNSCMRYKKCQNGDYFKVYGDNAKMLVMVPNKGKRLLGRAILWEIDGKIYMDRVYTVTNYIEHQFYNYAKANNWIILARNSYTQGGASQIQKWLSPEDKYETPHYIDLTVNLKEGCNHFPFMDSFCYLSLDKTQISTTPFVNGFVLQSVNGGYYGN